MIESCCGRRRAKRSLRAGSRQHGYSPPNNQNDCDSGGEETGLLGDHSPPQIGGRIPVARSIREVHLSSGSVAAAPPAAEADASLLEDEDFAPEDRTLELCGVKVLLPPRDLYDSAGLVFEVVETPPGEEEESVTYRSWDHCTVNVRPLALLRATSALLLPALTAAGATKPRRGGVGGRGQQVAARRG